MRSLDFVQTRLLMKLLKLFMTGSVILFRKAAGCAMFKKDTVSNLILNRKQNVLNKLVEINDNTVRCAISTIARSEVNSIH